ncbi:helix-turn-helix transcriptional regulator [Methylomonas sp. AM2-LC]|uniref:AraC family transcriptional regulator n=1 Tax=Methylomonas sp. AM2-LC TaxID=3153301 RepID=UPI003263CFF8
MNKGKLTTLPPVELGYRISVEHPVIPLQMQVSRAGCAAPHAHPRGQLIYASSGVMRIVCSGNSWVTPPTQAVWIPAMVEHEVYFPGDVTMYSMFIDPGFAERLPKSCIVLKVSTLLHELIQRAANYGENYRINDNCYRLMIVLIDEIAQAESTDIHLPSAKDLRLLRVLDALMLNPDKNQGLEALAKIANTSSRTLARLFVNETGLTFGQWRKRLILHIALSRLAEGESVTQVAIDLGYESISAFIDMFRSTLGNTPGHYFKSQNHTV